MPFPRVPSVSTHSFLQLNLKFVIELLQSLGAEPKILFIPFQALNGRFHGVLAPLSQLAKSFHVCRIHFFLSSSRAHASTRGEYSFRLSKRSGLLRSDSFRKWPCLYAFTNMDKPAPAEGSNSQPATTLLDIKRRARKEREAELDDSSYRKVRVLDFVAQDFSPTERRLHTYYCSVCGAHCLVTDGAFDELPRRRDDGSLALHNRRFHKKNVLEDSVEVRLRRKDGVEVQSRFKCKDCEFPLGYVPVPPNEFCYFFKDAVIADQMQALALRTE
eukprot:Polyplicarium_translucidae@DN1813_c0_g1_i3.p1